MTFHDPQMAAGGKAVLLTGPFGTPDRTIELGRAMTIAEVIAEHDLAFRLPTIAVMNGEPVLRGVWAVRVIRPSDIVAFIAVPGGGGGGGEASGKQIIGLVAALALSVAAPLIGGALFGAGTIAASIASAALLAGGSMLLNVLFAPPTAASQDAAAAEKVYSVVASNNQATPLDVVPVLYGRLRFPPRYASRPYSEYAGNDQYLYQLFLVTAGKAEIERIDIGETEAWNSTTGYSSSFSDLSFQIVQPGGTITLFPANVVTSSEVAGQSIPNPGDVLGPFVVNAAGTTVDRLAVDFAFPGGLWTADGRAVAANSIALRAQYQQINNAGAPIGGWVNLFAETISAATRTPQRMSRATAVPAGRYHVRFLADEAFDPDDGQAVNRAVWSSLRGYLTGFVTPPNCTLLAMRVRANEQLSQVSSSQIRVTATRHLPVWTGTEWVLQASRSIAWAAADILRNSDYSVGLTESQYDLASLAALATTWAERGDTFNGLFDRSWTSSDALRAVLRAGRAQMVRIAGKVGFVRLQPRSIKRATFTPRNVVRSSFQHRLVMLDEEQPDYVIGSFIDETTWQTRTVTASLASIGSDAPQTLEWFGITNQAQAWRESVTEAAVNAFQREFVSFTADWEGKLLVRGDPILVQHPFVEGVETVALSSRSGNVLTLDRGLEREIVDDAYVIIRGKDGREWGPCLVDEIDGRTVVLNASDLAAVSSSMGSLTSILPGPRAEKAHILVCEGDLRPFNGLVVSATPDASGKVSILAVIDAPEVYLADATEVMPSPWTPPTLPPQNPAAPLVLGLYGALRAGIAQLELEAMWQPSPGAIGGYVAEVSYDADTVPDNLKTWTPIWSGMQNRFTVPILPQAPVLRVAAIGVLRGAWSKRVFTLGELPTIKVPEEFFDLDGIKNEVIGSVAELDRETRINVRDLIEEKRQQVLLAVQGQLADYSDRQLMRRALVAQSGEDRAEFSEQILAAVGPGSAIVTRIEELRAEVFDPDSGLPATAEAVSLLSAEVHNPETGLEALANMVDLLSVSYGDISADGLLSVEVGIAPAGVSSRAILSTRATAGGAVASAALMLDSRISGGTLTSEVLLVGGRISLVASTSPSATKRGLLVVDGDNVYIDNARIRELTAGNIATRSLTADKIAAGSLTSAEINVAQLVASNAFLTNLVIDGSANIANLSVGRLQLATGSVTDFPAGSGSVSGTVGEATRYGPNFTPIGPFLWAAAVSVSSGGGTRTASVFLETVPGGTRYVLAFANNGIISTSGVAPAGLPYGTQMRMGVTGAASDGNVFGYTWNVAATIAVK